MPSSAPGSAFRYLVLSSAFSHSPASTAASISASRATVAASVRQGKCGSGSSCAMGASARRSARRVRPISSGAPSGQSKALAAAVALALQQGAVEGVLHLHAHSAGRVRSPVDAQVCGRHMRVVQHQVAFQAAAHGDGPARDGCARQQRAVAVKGLQQGQGGHHGAASHRKDCRKRSASFRPLSKPMPRTSRRPSTPCVGWLRVAASTVMSYRPGSLR
jgi:hypothetical protein